jgi:16S rRNA U516 pseudouridylate synthase RsuA-like enzyme
LFEHFDHKVVKLIRVGFGQLALPDDLAPGDYRQLTSDEIHQLKIATELA